MQCFTMMIHKMIDCKKKFHYCFQFLFNQLLLQLLHVRPGSQGKGEHDVFYQFYKRQVVISNKWRVFLMFDVLHVTFLHWHLHCHYVFFITSPALAGVKYCNQFVCMSVTHVHISGPIIRGCQQVANLMQLSCHVVIARGQFLLRWVYSLFASSLQSTISCISIQFSRWQHDCRRSLLSFCLKNSGLLGYMELFIIRVEFAF